MGTLHVRGSVNLSVFLSFLPQVFIDVPGILSGIASNNNDISHVYRAVFKVCSLNQQH